MNQMKSLINRKTILYVIGGVILLVAAIVVAIRWQGMQATEITGKIGRELPTVAPTDELPPAPGGVVVEVSQPVQKARQETEVLAPTAVSENTVAAVNTVGGTKKGQDYTWNLCSPVRGTCSRWCITNGGITWAEGATVPKGMGIKVGAGCYPAK
ncbi:hypothetical protein M1116_00100 [Patescibacteria group bacterium]|nr:hypothetical protein [Patescibacteria group bacterium]